MELSLGLFFGNQGQIRQPLSEEISLLKCSSRSKQKILGLIALHYQNTCFSFLDGSESLKFKAFRNNNIFICLFKICPCFSTFE